MLCEWARRPPILRRSWIDGWPTGHPRGRELVRRVPRLRTGLSPPETNYIALVPGYLSGNRLTTKQPSTGFHLIWNRAWIHG